MLRKIVVLACVLLAACTSYHTPKNYSDDFSPMVFLGMEAVQISSLIQTPDNKIYLLGEKEDYEFSATEARYLAPLLQPSYMIPILKEQEGSGSLGIVLYADRSNNKIQLEYGLYLDVKHLDTLRDSVRGLDKRWRVFYGSGDCYAEDFFKMNPSECSNDKPRDKMNFIIDRHPINGRIVQLDNREEILKDSAQSFPIEVSLRNYRVKRGSEKLGDMTHSATGGVKKAALIVTAPIWVPPMLLLFRKCGRACVGG